MSAVNKIDSNATGLSYAEEETLGVLPLTPVWKTLEPNSYSDFGGQITQLSRRPINADRQRKKGVITDLDASGGFNSDLTATNLKDILQGAFFANLRKKNELTIPTITSGEFQPASGGGVYIAGDLLFARGFANSANNGLHQVSGTPGASSIPVTSTLVAATSQTGSIIRVGYQFGSADAVIDVAGNLPALTTTTKDLTTLGLIVGEWIYIGGDLTAQQFNSAVNNGFARVRSIAAHRIEFDKTANTMIADTGTGKTIRIFFGTILKNETGSNIVRKSYQLERLLGAPDNSNLSQIQSEYLIGAVINEVSFNISQADKVNVDLTFVATDHEQRTGVTGIKSGTRATFVSEDAFNTSSDIPRIYLSKVIDGEASPSPLFSFVTELTITINNNVSPNKAVGHLGAFDVTAGLFEVSGEMTAYFSNVEAVEAVRANSDITFDVHLVKFNSGITWDLPLISLGDGRLNVEQDQAITLPLTTEAADASKLDPLMNYTLLMVFWDYLPTLAG